MVSDWDGMVPNWENMVPDWDNDLLICFAYVSYDVL
jgi:hypothetical protein